jgi:hypothetical protein
MNTQTASGNRYLRVDTGQSYTIALKSLAPREVPGNYGPQLLWILTDGRALYTPLTVKAQIEKLGVKPYKPFVIGKYPNGQRTEWRVTLPNPQRADTPVRHETKERSGGEPVAAILDAHASLDSPVEVERPRTRLEDALKTAVSAAAIAEKHGQAIGYNVRFAPGDIRAMAISVLIGMESRGGRAA